MYPIYYFVTIFNFEKKYLCSSILLLLLYIVIYIFLDTTIYTIETIGFHGIRFSYIFSFFSMITGAYIRKNIDAFLNLKKSKRSLMIAISIISFCGYVIFSVAIKKFPQILNYQFFETILVLSFAISVFLAFLSFEYKFKKYEKNKGIKFLSYISEHTLEIYLVQFIIIDFVRMSGLKFPISWIVTVACILFAAIILKKLSQKLIKIFITRK